MALKNIDHFQYVVPIAEKDNIAFKRKAAGVGAQLRPSAPQHSGQARQMSAFVAQLAGEMAADGKAARLSRDVIEDGNKVAACRRGVDEATHLESRLGQFICLCIQRLVYSVVIVFASFGD